MRKQDKSLEMRTNSTDPSSNCPWSKLSKPQLLERARRTSKALGETNKLHQKWIDRREIEIEDKKANENLFQYVREKK